MIAKETIFEIPEVEERRQSFHEDLDNKKNEEEISQLSETQENIISRLTELERIMKERIINDTKIHSPPKESNKKLSRVSKIITQKPETNIESRNYDNEIQLLVKSINNCASKESLEEIKQSFIDFQTIFLSKVNSQNIQTIHKENNEESNIGTFRGHSRGPPP